MSPYQPGHRNASCCKCCLSCRPSGCPQEKMWPQQRMNPAGMQAAWLSSIVSQSFRGLEGAAALPGFRPCRLGAHTCPAPLACGSQAVSPLLCDFGNSVSARQGPTAPGCALFHLCHHLTRELRGGKGTAGSCVGGSRLLSWTWFPADVE